MKTIKILGTGCPNCKTTEEIVKKASEELNLEVNIVKVEDIQDIMAYDIMSTPAVVINEKVVIKGRVPKIDEIKALLQEEIVNIDDNCSSEDNNETSSGCCCS